MRKTFAWVLGLAVAASAIGCGDKSSDAGKSGDAAKSGGAASSGESFDPKSAVGVWLMDTKPIADMMKPMMEGLKTMAAAMPDGPEKAKMLKEAESKLADLGKMKVVLTLKKDGSATMESDMPSEAPDASGLDHELNTGTWTQKGEIVTIVQKTKNGKPAEGSSAEPKDLTLKDGKLSLSDDGMTMSFSRK